LTSSFHTTEDTTTLTSALTFLVVVNTKLSLT
jgi:hypothetical protein